MAGLSGFSYYKAITISTTNCDADLTNFPVYIPIVNDADIGGECLATGYDIQFADATNDNVLTFERLAGFAVAGGQANGDFYVLVPTVAGAADTVIRCYYGKAGATDVSSSENTFLAANGWSAVWHLEESGNPYFDATSNNNDSTDGIYPTQATGKVAKGQDFELGSSQYISIPDSTTLDMGASDDFTISAWINIESAGATRYIVAKTNAGLTDYSWAFTLNADPCIKISLWDNADSVNNTDWDYTLSTGVWIHVAARCDRDSSTGLITFYNSIPNTSTSNPTTIGDMSNAWPTTIGARLDDTTTALFFDGIIDELRVSKTLRSDAWIKFEYYNSDDGHAAGNELAWGAETSTSAVPYISRVIGPF